MTDFKDRMADYVPVNERVDAFYAKFPDGSIQGEIVELTADRVTVKASVYRHPEDPRPGVGHSSLEIPGSTPYTRGSEIENAETSAWGRAIAALGFEVKRGIASREEVSNKQPQSAAVKPASGARALPPEPDPLPPLTDDDAPPDADELLEGVLAITGGELVEPPADLTERIQRAEAKGQPHAAAECPAHGSQKVKKNRKGYYCATRVGDDWCDWQVAA